MSEAIDLTKKQKAFLKKAFTGRAKILGPAGSHLLRFGDQNIAYGYGWGSLESTLSLPEEVTFSVLERQNDGATLLLTEGRSLDEACSIAKLHWDQFGYRCYFVGAAAEAARSELPPDSPGVLHHASGADIFVHEFSPEQTMLAFSLHDGDGTVFGIVLGDTKSLAPIAPPPLGCPVLRALVSEYAEIYRLDAKKLFADPAISARIEASHRSDKKARASLATIHTERALQHLLTRVARLLEQHAGFSEDAEQLRRRPVRLVRGCKWEELQALEMRIQEAESIAHPALSAELRYPYVKLTFGAAGGEMTPVERDLLDLGSHAGMVSAACLGPKLFTANLKGVRAWQEASDLARLCDHVARAALNMLAWSRWPDVEAARTSLDALAAEPPAIEPYLRYVCEEADPGPGVR